MNAVNIQYFFVGREADRNGQLVKWWPDSDIKNYQNKVRCFEKQYGNLGVNGLHTIGENIADNVGLQISLSAFKKLRSSKLHVIVPELELFTNEQLYFISFAQVSILENFLHMQDIGM